MPVYNSEHYLKISVENILNQSFEDFELICLYDKSNEKKQQILLECGLMDSRVIVRDNEKNFMQSFNESIKQAKGDYILFVDSLNVIEKDFLDKIHKKIKEYPIDLLLFKSLNNGVVYEKTSKLLALRQNEIFNYEQISDLIFDIDNSLYSTLYNKNFLLKQGISFNTEFSYDETFFYKALLNSGKIAYLDIHPYKTDNKKIKSYSLKQFIEYIQIQNFLIELYDEKFIKQTINNKISNTIKYYNLIDIGYKKQAYTLLREDCLFLLNKKNSEIILNMLNEENYKNFEQIIISETVEEYDLLKKIHQDKKDTNFNKRYEKILKTEHKKIKQFNDSLFSSRSWKLTKIFRLR